MVGAKRFPMLVPMSKDDPALPMVKQAKTRLQSFTKPFLCMFAPQDPLLGWASAWYQKNVPGTHGMPHQDIEGAGHFLQEDQGARLAEAMRQFIAHH
jgi:haloalkane dehalogenase